MNRTTFFLLLLFLIPVVFLSAQETEPVNDAPTQRQVNVKGPKASWDVLIHDLGEMTFKSKKKVDYTLTNSGNEPLFITYAQSSCGCAYLEYNEAPVMPGKFTKLTVTYHGTEIGNFMKTISVVTNADTDRTILQIKGRVVKK